MKDFSLLHLKFFIIVGFVAGLIVLTKFISAVWQKEKHKQTDNNTTNPQVSKIDVEENTDKMIIA